MTVFGGVCAPKALSRIGNFLVCVHYVAALPVTLQLYAVERQISMLFINNKDSVSLPEGLPVSVSVSELCFAKFKT